MPLQPQDFYGDWIDREYLIAGQWLRLIKLSDLGLSVRKIAQKHRLSYNVPYEAVHTIRSAILSRPADGEIFWAANLR